jgi:hypothetical protein
MQKKKPTKKNARPAPDYCMKVVHVLFSVLDGAVQREVTDGEDFCEFVHGRKDVPPCVVSCRLSIVCGVVSKEEFGQVGVHQGCAMGCSRGRAASKNFLL